jgi:hypothetical protein
LSKWKFILLAGFSWGILMSLTDFIRLRLQHQAFTLGDALADVIVCPLVGLGFGASMWIFLHRKKA